MVVLFSKMKASQLFKDNSAHFVYFYIGILAEVVQIAVLASDLMQYLFPWWWCLGVYPRRLEWWMGLLPLLVH